MTNTLVHFVTLMGIFGIPSIFSMTMWCVKTCRQYTRQIRILMQAQQAQMRSQLLKDYNEYSRRGYITDMELKDWENQYIAYHELGANGVLDDRYAKLLDLPNYEE